MEIFLIYSFWDFVSLQDDVILYLVSEVCTSFLCFYEKIGRYRRAESQTQRPKQRSAGSGMNALDGIAGLDSRALDPDQTGDGGGLELIGLVPARHPHGILIQRKDTTESCIYV